MSAKMNGHRSTGDLWPEVERALHDRRFDLRTYSGISKDIGVSPPDIQAAVAENRDQIRFSRIATDKGERLFTLATRPKSWREKLTEVRHILASLA